MQIIKYTTLHNAFICAVKKNKKRITRYKLLERVADCLHIDVAHLEAVTIEMCNSHMIKLGWVYSSDRDEFIKNEWYV